VRRRRKTKYVWLPTQNGRQFGVDSTHGFSNGVSLAISLGGAIGSDNIIGWYAPLADVPQDDITNALATEGIGEVINNEYVLKRIVGKCFCWIDLHNSTGSGLVGEQIAPFPVVVTAGMFIARTDPNLPTQPIAAPTAGQALYAPNANHLIREPWIWRRSWILSPCNFGVGLPQMTGSVEGVINTGTAYGGGTFPANNAMFGSVMDGPHIDAKTGRRVRLNERVWFAASATPFAAQAWGPNVDTISGAVFFYNDFRFLGALRKPRARSNFA